MLIQVGVSAFNNYAITLMEANVILFDFVLLGVVIQSVTAESTPPVNSGFESAHSVTEELAQYKQLIRQQDARLQELMYQLEQTQALRVFRFFSLFYFLTVIIFFFRFGL